MTNTITITNLKNIFDTAQEALDGLLKSSQLTDEQKDTLEETLNEYNVYPAEHAEYLFKMMLTGGTGGLQDADIITTLYQLLDYSDDDLVIADGDDIQPFDWDILDDVLQSIQ